MTTTALIVPMLGLGIGPLGLPEMIILAILGVLIFGKRLPEVGKSLGKGIVEFKKGLAGIDDEPAPTPKADPHRLEKSPDAHAADVTPAEQQEAPKGT